MLSIVLIIVLLLLVRKWKLKRYMELSKKIKCGLRSYPLIGHVYLFYGDGEKQMNTIKKFGRDAIRNGGLTHMWLGGKFYLFSADALDNEVILKKALDKDSASHVGRSLTGNGFIFAPVHIWRPRRKCLAPAFNSKYLNSYMEVFSRQCEIMVGQMGRVVGNGAVSIWNNMVALSFDSVCETTLAIQLNAQLHSEEPFLKSLEDIGNLLAYRMLQPLLHSDVVYKLLPRYTQFAKHKDILYNFIKEVVRSKRTARKNEEKSSQKVRSILEYLIECGYSDLELEEDVLVVMIAGTDTSAKTTCFALSLLARHTDVQDKIVQELLEVFGDSYRPVTLDDLPRLKYLEAVIKETLRLYPTVPILGRQVFTDLELPSGITLVKGCSVLVNIWATHRNPVYWGDDAELFRPERFFDAPPKYPAAFQPFGLGSRACLGYKYGMMLIKTILATFLRTYIVSSPDRDEINNTSTSYKPMRLSFKVLMKDIDGWKIRLEKRTRGAPLNK